MKHLPLAAGWLCCVRGVLVTDGLLCCVKCAGVVSMMTQQLLLCELLSITQVEAYVLREGAEKPPGCRPVSSACMNQDPTPYAIASYILPKQHLVCQTRATPGWRPDTPTHMNSPPPLRFLPQALLTLQDMHACMHTGMPTHFHFK